MDVGHANGGSQTDRETRVGQVDPGYTWEDLVLPEEELERLRSISRHLRLRERHVSGQSPEASVRRKPVRPVLFLGAAGTGKTMAAQIIAADMDVPLHQLDLATALAQPEHEFERIAARAFESAEGDGAILVIDGAGALVRRSAPAGWHGGRSSQADKPSEGQQPTGGNGHDPGDRSLSRLLRRADRSEGLVIFTSTVTHGIDTALTNRFEAQVNFPLPETEARKEIWRRSLPADAQLPESNLDYLAGWLKWPGGTIHRCCLAAADAAAQERVPVQLRHVAGVLDQGYRSSGRPARTPAPVRSGPGTPPPPRPSAPVPARPHRHRRPAAPARPRHRRPSGPVPARPHRHRRPAAPARPRHRRPSGPVPARPHRHRRPAAPARPRRRRPCPSGSGPPAPPPAPVRSGTGTPAPAPVGSAPDTPPATRGEPRTSAGRRWPLPAVGVVLAALVIGAIVALTTAGSSRNGTSKAAYVDAVRVSYPSNWRQTAPAANPTLGLTGELAVASPAPTRGELVIGKMAQGDASPLPPTLMATLPSTAAPQIVKVGRVVFYRYLGSPQPGESVGESVYAMPTTTGTVIGVCRPQGNGAAFASSCQRVLATLQLTSGKALPLTLSTSYASELNAVIGRLNAVRASAGPQLAAATSAHTQAAAATQLAQAHGQAASALVHLGAGVATAANAALAHALLVTADAYTALAQAAVHNNPHAYSTARADLARSAQALSLAFGQLRRLGYQVA